MTFSTPHFIKELSGISSFLCITFSVTRSNPYFNVFLFNIFFLEKATFSVGHKRLYIIAIKFIFFSLSLTTYQSDIFGLQNFRSSWGVAKVGLIVAKVGTIPKGQRASKNKIN